MPTVTLSSFAPLHDVHAVRGLDPLGADDLCRRLPALNAGSDVGALVAGLHALAPERGAVQDYTVAESVAAVRDLGILLGSLRRHGVEPLQAVPELTDVLVTLGRRSDMVPRDTVHHYTAWNPTGARQRMYTGDRQEGYLQDAVRLVFPGLRDALATCEDISGLDPADEAFASNIERLGQLVGSMVRAMDLVNATVSPTFFARELRPYYEEFTVAGRSYLGPGAAQVPLWMVDLTLWASDRRNADYYAFLRESAAYSPAPWRAFYAARLGTASAVTKLHAAANRAQSAGGPYLPEPLASSARALAAVLRTLKTFRGRHYRIARQAYDEKVRLYDTGSRGEPVQLLRTVLGLTRQNETLLRRGLPPPPAGDSHADRPHRHCGERECGRNGVRA